MDIITLDFETFFSDTHSLTKMNPILYVMHPETEIQSVAIKVNDGKTIVVFGEEKIRKLFAQIDWSSAAICAHNNSEFDAMIAAWRFGLKPKMWMCTLAMARPHYKLDVGGSLKSLCSKLGLGEKGSLDAVNTKGKKLKDFTPEEVAKMKVYNRDDTDLCYALLTHLLPLLPKAELRIIDATIRMLVEPRYEVDVELLTAALETERARKREAILKVAKICGVYQSAHDEDEAIAAMQPILMSQQKFAALLDQLGAEVPLKESKTTGLMIPALAKSDDGMVELLEHDDPAVAAAAAGRLGVKSSQLETRLQSFISVAEAMGGVMPMPYRYCGADATWRMSGTMKLNVQNMPRVDEKKPKPADSLRSSLRAPKGKVVVVVDSSNIELRTTHCFSGQNDTTEMLRTGMDLYCDFATTLFGRQITKADFMERFMGKTAHLGLQYGAAHAAFQRMVRYLSRQMGQFMDISDEESARVVTLWRGRHRQISDREYGMWGKCERAIQAMHDGNTIILDDYDMCYTAKNRLITPGGRFLYYPDLRRVTNSKGKTEWRYGSGRHERRLYGSMLLENIAQHLSRNIVMEQQLELRKYAPVLSSTHDESSIIVPEYMADEAVKVAIEIFSTPPKWWPQVPLAAEAGFSENYGGAK